MSELLSFESYSVFLSFLFLGIFTHKIIRSFTYIKDIRQSDDESDAGYRYRLVQHNKKREIYTGGFPLILVLGFAVSLMFISWTSENVGDTDLRVFLQVTGGAVGLSFEVVYGLLYKKIGNMDLEGTRYKNLSIVGTMLRKDLRVTNLVIILAIGGLIALWFIDHQYALNVSSLPYYLLILLLTLPFLNFWIFYVRVKKGWFGTTDWEARKIIKFIQENYEEIDRNNSGGGKVVLFKDNDLSQFHNEIGLLTPKPKGAIS